MSSLYSGADDWFDRCVRPNCWMTESAAHYKDPRSAISRFVFEKRERTLQSRDSWQIAGVFVHGQLEGDVHPPALVLDAVVGLQRDAGRARLGDDRDALDVVLQARPSAGLSVCRRPLPIPIEKATKGRGGCSSGTAVSRSAAATWKSCFSSMLTFSPSVPERLVYRYRRPAAPAGAGSPSIRPLRPDSSAASDRKAGGLISGGTALSSSVFSLPSLAYTGGGGVCVCVRVCVCVCVCHRQPTARRGGR